MVKYKVLKGDTLSSISKKYYGNANRYMDIARKNGITDVNSLSVGQELKIDESNNKNNNTINNTNDKTIKGYNNKNSYSNMVNNQSKRFIITQKYKMGGNDKLKPNVVRGGQAIPLKGKTNYYYMQGRKHKDGGIDIGENPRTGLEVEDGEVMHVSNNEIKVFSSVPFLNGKSPAQKVMGGENPTKVFNQQEEFKDRKGLNDDGTKKKQNGGSIKYIYNKVDKKNTPDFIRMRDVNRKSIPDWNKKGFTSTNKVSIGTDENGQDFLYNDIQDDGKGGLIDMTNPKNYKNGKYMGDVRAIERGDTIHINSIKDGLIFSKDYKKS